MLTRKQTLVLGVLALVPVACREAAQPKAPEPSVRAAAPEAIIAKGPAPTQEAPPESTLSAAKPFPNIDSTRLKNGMALDVIERRAMPIVDLTLVVTAGRARDASHPGAAHVLAQFLEAGGAGRWSSEKLREVVDGLGASLEVATDRDSMRWSLAVTSDKVPEA